MSTTSIVTLILAITGPFVLVLVMDVVHTLAGRAAADDENTGAERD